MTERRQKVEFGKFKQYVDFNEDVVNIMSGFVSLQKQCGNTIGILVLDVIKSIGTVKRLESTVESDDTNSYIFWHYEFHMVRHIIFTGKFNHQSVSLR